MSALDSATTIPVPPLGSYSVTAKIGEGGKGEVYRARLAETPGRLALDHVEVAYGDGTP